MFSCGGEKPVRWSRTKNDTRKKYVLNAIIEKAVSVISDYEHYAGQAGVGDYWCSRIKEETGYRIAAVR